MARDKTTKPSLRPAPRPTLEFSVWRIPNMPRRAQEAAVKEAGQARMPLAQWLTYAIDEAALRHEQVRQARQEQAAHIEAVAERHVEPSAAVVERGAAPMSDMVSALKLVAELAGGTLPEALMADVVKTMQAQLRAVRPQVTPTPRGPRALQPPRLAAPAKANNHNGNGEHA